MQQKTRKSGACGLRAGLRRVAALGVAAPATAALALPTGAFAAELNKTASGLDARDQTDVQLSIGATQSKDKVAVMFLLDKSTSQGMRDEAAAMIDELAAMDNTDIIYDVVVFSGSATASGWKNAQGDDLQQVKEEFANKETTSGTNMDAGIEKATAEMNALPADYADATTYLITLSDGITYVWNENGVCSSVPTAQYDAKGEGIEDPVMVGPDNWNQLYSYYQNPEPCTIEHLFGSFDSYLKDVEPRLENTRAAGYVYPYGTIGEQYLTSYIYDGDKTKEIYQQFATSPDFALYESATGYAELVKQFDNSFAFAAPEAKSDGSDNTNNWGLYPWGRDLMLYLAGLSTNGSDKAEISNADAAEVFSSIENVIRYEFQSGTVTDVIGSDFDLTDGGNIKADTFTLTVGGQELAGTVDAENPNKVNFDNGAYSVEYQVSGDTETLVWSINKPVESAAGVTLSYNLTLVNKSTEPGDHTAKTNEKATVTYKPTTGGDVTETFPVPQVTYNVPEPTPEPAQDALRFEPNAEGATGITPSVTDDEYATVTVSENGFALDGYEFAGWNTAADGSGTAYAPGDPYTLTDADDVLYAQWKKVEEPTKPVEEKPADTTEQKDDDSTLPSTGDIAGMTAGAVAFAGAAAAGIGATLKRRR